MKISINLNKYVNPYYKKFHKKICQTNYEILGVKIPILRNIAKDLLKKYSYKEILSVESYYHKHIINTRIIPLSIK